jgi:hypothetical protein
MSAHAIFPIVHRTRNHRCGRRIADGEKDVIGQNLDPGPRFFGRRPEHHPRSIKECPVQSPPCSEHAPFAIARRSWFIVAAVHS